MQNVFYPFFYTMLNINIKLLKPKYLRRSKCVSGNVNCAQLTRPNFAYLTRQHVVLWSCGLTDRSTSAWVWFRAPQGAQRALQKSRTRYVLFSLTWSVERIHWSSLLLLHSLMLSSKYATGWKGIAMNFYGKSLWSWIKCRQHHHRQVS